MGNKIEVIHSRFSMPGDLPDAETTRVKQSNCLPTYGFHPSVVVLESFSPPLGKAHYRGWNRPLTKWFKCDFSQLFRYVWEGFSGGCGWRWESYHCFIEREVEGIEINAILRLENQGTQIKAFFYLNKSKHILKNNFQDSDLAS